MMLRQAYDQGGFSEPLHCVICGGALEVKEDERGREARCPCGRTQFVFLPGGELELGIVRDSVLTDVPLPKQ